MSMEYGLYARVLILSRKGLKIAEENKNKMKLNSSSKVSLQDCSIGLILVLIGLGKMLAHVNLISVGKYFKGMTKHRI